MAPNNMKIRACQLISNQLDTFIIQKIHDRFDKLK